jgi:hypothetical protein
MMLLVNVKMGRSAVPAKRASRITPVKKHYGVLRICFKTVMSMLLQRNDASPC